MTFRVLWQESAEQELSRIWLGSRFRSQIVESVTELDGRLQRAPHTVGESREEGHRIAFAPPLAIRFLVNEADRVVVVLNLWQTHRIG